MILFLLGVGLMVAAPLLGLVVYCVHEYFRGR